MQQHWETESTNDGRCACLVLSFFSQFNVASPPFTSLQSLSLYSTVHNSSQPDSLTVFLTVHAKRLLSLSLSLSLVQTKVELYIFNLFSHNTFFFFFILFHSFCFGYIMEKWVLLEWRSKKELSLCLIMVLLFFQCHTVSPLDDHQGSSFFCVWTSSIVLFCFVFSFCQEFSMVEACFVAQRSYNKKLPTMKSKLLFLALKNH